MKPPYLLVLLILSLCVVCGGYRVFSQNNQINPCWYRSCPPRTSCVVQRFNCYGWSCPSFAQCVPVKEDFCPWAPNFYNFIPCVNQCSYDAQCSDDEKCCQIGRCLRCVDSVDSPWDRTVTSESADERADSRDD